ncbi:hypothetical protein CEP52_010191 [Fusarium oligoseptatum]|uniref:Uncharacterized protein n=1 Tax=Fusarium oligoseptatum TaxID=2604345 RepID=A0A428T9D2_9HYPO|nr:hypothetical protein CEP52_010191 [Fusarium oligoseptatum]
MRPTVAYFPPVFLPHLPVKVGLCLLLQYFSPPPLVSSLLSLLPLLLPPLYSALLCSAIDFFLLPPLSVPLCVLSWATPTCDSNPRNTIHPSSSRARAAVWNALYSILARLVTPYGTSPCPSQLVAGRSSTPSLLARPPRLDSTRLDSTSSNTLQPRLTRPADP